MSSKTFARAQWRVPLKELEATKSINHISKNSRKSFKIPNYTRRAHVLRDVK